MQKTFSTFIVMLSCSLALAQAPNTYDLNPGNGNGLRFWSSDSYKIHMGNAAEYKYGPVTDYSIKMNMGNTATRGWTWGVQNTVPIAALSTLGHMQIAGNFVSMGNIGIGNTTPIAKLQVTNGSVLFDGATGTTPISGAGTRMMWIPAKYSFRAGQTSGTTWDDVNIGNGSAAFGYNTKASGLNSFAIGNVTTASGNNTFTYGSLSTASGTGSFAGGNNVTAQSFNSFVIGRYNYNPGNYNPTGWILTDPLFVIGNGSSAGATSNAMTVLKNGNVGIGKIAPTEMLDVAGNINVNANKLYLQSGDINHGLGYFHTYTTTGNYANKDFDGPVLFGWEGGGLGTNRGSDRNVALSWNYLGQVGIGTPYIPNDFMLAVKGKIIAEELNVKLRANWPDYVFANNYQLRSIKELENFIKQNNHLPEMPPAEEIEKNGINTSELITKLLKQQEELTLYIIEQNKRIEALENK